MFTVDDSTLSPFVLPHKFFFFSFLEDMWGTKRGGDYLTRRSNRSRRARDGREEKDESLTSGMLVLPRLFISFLTALFEHSWLCCMIFLQLGDMSRGFYQDAWTRLSDKVKSNLARSVASLALCNGDSICPYTVVCFPANTS